MINDDVDTRMGDKETIIKEQIKNTHFSAAFISFD